MPPVMITWVTPMAMMPTIETCRMMIFQPRLVEERCHIVAGVEQEAVADDEAAQNFKGRDDEQQRHEHVEFRRPRPFRGIILQAANAMGCLCHLHPPPMDASAPVSQLQLTLEQDAAL